MVSCWPLATLLAIHSHTSNLSPKWTKPSLGGRVVRLVSWYKFVTHEISVAGSCSSATNWQRKCLALKFMLSITRLES